jgi:NAD(P)-dependent dehydrogenase (short-subunit alcohol dehydrogenase family)
VPGALEGRYAVVTGASRGIGAAVAAALRAEGAVVARIARSLAPAGDARGLDLRADLTDDAQCAAALDAVLARGTPHLVVSSTGAFALAPLEDQPLAGLDAMYRANVRAPFAVARRLLPAMRAGGGGRHVLLGSIADYRALPGNTAYAATKFGARGLHEVLREEFRGSGVLCTLISPGPTDTPLWDPLAPDAREDLPSRAAMLRPGDVAEAVRWVATRPAGMDVGLIQLGPA